MHFIYLSSSDISAIAINSNNLIIKFNSGGVYEYFGAAKEYNGLIHAGSAGGYFHKFIKNNYKYKKIS